MIALLLALAGADQPASYDLRNPTPAAQLREFTPDRPDTTEGPYTVDPGHVQIELSLAEYSIARDRSRTLDALPVLVKLGLTDSVDVELAFTPYQRVDSPQDGITSGFGDDTRLRLKINLQGNDGDGAAFGLIPFVKLPTGTGGLSNGHVEGGLILPATTDLPGDFSLAGMLEADLVWHDEDRDYGVDLIHTLSLGHAIAGPLSGYVEYVGIAPQGAPTGRESRYQAIGSAGFTYEMRDDLVLDAGARLGFSGDSDRAAIFVGASTRF